MDESRTTTGTTPVAVIVNARSGGGHDAAWAKQLTGMFATHGIAVRVELAADGLAVAEAVRRAMKHAPRMIVAGGGDGTVNCIATHLVDTDICLGVLPLGTLNHFAKDLKIPLALEEAVRTIAAAHTTRVDVGEVNDRIFLNNSSLGLYPDIVHDREQQQRRLGRGKWPAAAWAALAALRRYPFLSMRLDVNGERLARRTPFVFIGNNAYTMQGLAIGERARLDEGVLSLYVAQHPTRLGLLRFALDALRGRLGSEPDFDILQAPGFDIDTPHKRLRVATDGEVTVMNPPLRYRMRPGALTVLVPSPTIR